MREGSDHGAQKECHRQEAGLGGRRTRRDGQKEGGQGGRARSQQESGRRHRERRAERARRARKKRGRHIGVAGRDGESDRGRGAPHQGRSRPHASRHGREPEGSEPTCTPAARTARNTEARPRTSGQEEGRGWAAGDRRRRAENGRSRTRRENRDEASEGGRQETGQRGKTMGGAERMGRDGAAT